MSLIIKYPKPYKNVSKILLINTITTKEQCTITNLIYPKLESFIMGFNQENVNLPKLGVRYELNLVKNLTLVIGQKVSSQNPLKSITSTMVASYLA